MSTTRKSSQEISDIIIAQLESDLNQTIPLLPRSFLRVISKVLGGIFVLLYNYCGSIALQMFIKTASNKKMKFGSRELNPLEEWGRLVDVYQNLGIRSELEITISVLSQTGTLTSGTRFINTSTRMIYTLVGDVALNAASVTGNIRAVDVGSVGNVDVGSVLSFVSPPAQCSKNVSVSDLVREGSDAETTEHFRQNIKVRWASRPQGGSYADYWDWGRAVPGVKNVYPYSGWDISGLPNSGSGTIVVFVESEAGTDGIPSQAIMDDVLEYIQNDQNGLANRRPINAYTDISLIRPITRTAVNVTIGGLSSEDPGTLETNVELGLIDFFFDREPWITGLSIPPRKDVISLSEVMGVIGKICAADSIVPLNISVSIGGNTIDDYYQLQEGEKAKLGTLTWS